MVGVFNTQDSMKLFKYEGYNLTISEEALALAPFKTIWNRDKSKDKSRAIMELGFVYFMEDPRSDYQIYIDLDERREKIVEGEGFKQGWKPDKEVNAAMEFYAGFKSEAALLAEDLRACITNLRMYIRELDLNAVDEKGKPIYTLNSYTSALNEIPKLIKSLDEAEKTIARDIMQSDRVRGSAEKSLYEDV